MPTPSLDSIIGKLQRRCGLADYFLVRDFVEAGFRRVWEYREWSWRKKEAHIQFVDTYNTGTCSITSGTDVVNFAGGATFDATFIGRQWRPGTSFPIYTIIDVPSATSIQIDRLWFAADLAAGSTYEIYRCFFELAADCDSVINLVDPVGPSTVGDLTPQEELDVLDSRRSWSGGPIQKLSLRDYAGSGGAARYEAWPHQKAAKAVEYEYFVRMPDLSDSAATIPTYLTEDVLLQLSLAECAGWPGPENRPNPYYRLGLIELHEKRGMELLRILELADQNRVVTDVINPTDSIGSMFDDAYHQNHDVGWD